VRQAHQKLAEKLAPMAGDITLGLQSAADNSKLEAVKKMLGNWPTSSKSIITTKV
jgi:hypothetical protein